MMIFSARRCEAWNGHWACSDFVWKLVRGRRPYLLNRAPCSTHVDLLVENGFTVADKVPYSTGSAIRRADLSRRFAGLSESDLTTSSAFVVGVNSGAAR